MTPTSRPVHTKYVTIRVKLLPNGGIAIWSGGSTYEVVGDAVYVLPKMLKEMGAQWNASVKAYVVISHGNVLHVQDTILPSQLNLHIKYSGASAKRFISLLYKVLMRYHKGQPVVKLPLYDKDAYRLAVCFAKMSQLQDISDVV